MENNAFKSDPKAIEQHTKEWLEGQRQAEIMAFRSGAHPPCEDDFPDIFSEDAAKRARAFMAWRLYEWEAIIALHKFSLLGAEK